MRTSAVTAALPLPGDPSGGSGGPESPTDLIWRSLADGLLLDGDRLPATRTLAGTHGFARSAVVAAYESLTGAGVLTSRPGGGTWVAPGAGALARAGARTAVPAVADDDPSIPDIPLRSGRPVLDLRPGVPDIGLIDRPQWRRAWRAATAEVTDLQPTGHAPAAAKVAVLEHLRTFRGITADPDLVTLMPSVSAACAALAVSSRLAGRTIAMEDPGYPEAFREFAHHGMRVVPVPVDDDGLVVDRIPNGVDAVYVTPPHQYPLGVPLTLDRRRRLLEWAHATGGLIIEDDYDGEFRYDTTPLPAMRTMHSGADRVIYLGTTSKILTPEMRVAWVVAPAGTLDPPGARELTDVSGPAMRALTHLITTGALARHRARAMRTYAARRRALIEPLHARLPAVRVVGAAAGLHCTLLLPEGGAGAPARSEREVLDGLEAGGFLVSGLARYSPNRQPPGIVVGYARLPETAAGGFIRALGRAIEHG
ncbi:PLP-dependent aminotransferase family protein [Millisia brevis]|uniref:aminotransferase-like domain-containing protein n=1 Tax=Millisia brevis TaxID=264148 RepID=UPI00082AC9AF|nr:PLP-dependent aminotransferase family protein [Millisia brevis]